MIERQKVNGDPATVSYMTDEFTLVPKHQATLVKVTFDDGRVVFLQPDPSKATKASVDYRLGTPKQHCGICAMFIDPDKCASVEGDIKRERVCDLFEPAAG